MSIYIFDSGFKSNAYHHPVVVEIHKIPPTPLSFLIVNSFQRTIGSYKIVSLSIIGPVCIIVSLLMPQCANLIMP